MSGRKEAIALYDYTAKTAEELTLKKGDRLSLLEEEMAKLDAKNWWDVENEAGQTGFVPKNYLQLQKESSGKKWGVFKGGKHGKDGAGPATSAASMQVVCKARVKYNYQANREDELALVKKEVVDVIEKEDDGWWRGRVGDRVGWFPSNYVEEITDDKAQNPSKYQEPSAGPSRGMPVGTGDVLCTVRTKYNFQTDVSEELGFAKAEILQVIQKTEADWWSARNKAGKTGFIPRNYVEECDAALFNSSPTMPTRAAPAAPGVGSSPLAKYEWFHGRLSRNQGEDLLVSAKPGVFLVRESESRAGDFSVSLQTAERIRHFRIETKNGLYNIGQRMFSTLEELVEFYRGNPIFTSTDGQKVYLDVPLSKR